VECGRAQLNVAPRHSGGNGQTQRPMVLDSQTWMKEKI